MSVDKMKSKGFTLANDLSSQPRIIASISGLEKQGKTHFSLTAPGPIAMFSTDIGEEGVVEKFMDDKKIYIMHIDRVDEDSAEQAPKEYSRFHTAYLDMLRGKEVRTILIDTATEIWEILRMARFGRLTQVMPYQYGPVNAEYRALIREAYTYDKTLILTHKMKPQYINDKRTGEYDRAGFGDTGFLVQVNAQVYRYLPQDGGEFAIFVKDCRQEPSLAGEEFTGPMCTFPMLASMVLPNVDPKEWD
jgi:hypothetical protein